MAVKRDVVTLLTADKRRVRRWMEHHPRRFGWTLAFMRSRWCGGAVEAPRAEEVARAHAHPDREAASQRLLLARKLQTFADGIFGAGVVSWEVA